MAKKGYLSLIGADKPFKKPTKPVRKRPSKPKQGKSQGAGAKGAKRP